MYQTIKPEDWTTLNEVVLERNAIQVIKSTSNYLVVAGPGTGKTEILAQRASYLLQTGICRYPQKILALSYKKDAAKNIKERVEARVGASRSCQFTSITYDAFAKSLLDHFREALPEVYMPSDNYEIDVKGIVSVYRNLMGLQSIPRLRQNELKRLFENEICKLPPKEETGDFEEINRIWEILLHGNNISFLTFPTISTLAEYIIQLNPIIRKAIRLTYRYIFLDEFQDTTTIQYELVKTCFLDSGIITTAVGDDEQRIMVWAGADKDIFVKFLRDFNADQIRLLQNHRAVPKLQQLQRSISNLFEEQYRFDDFLDMVHFHDGKAEVLSFQDEDQEASVLAEKIKTWITKDKIKPRDICILVRCFPGTYGEKLINWLESQGISIRDEGIYQNLLAEPCTKTILDIILLAIGECSHDACANTLQLYNALKGTAFVFLDQSKIRSSNQEFDGFLTSLHDTLISPNSQEVLKSKFTQILGFLGMDLFKNFFPQYRNEEYLDENLETLSVLLWNEFNKTRDMGDAIRSLCGESSIPLMTIHKSKGLEFDTVVLLGLEDDAFWSFSDNRDDGISEFLVALSRAKRQVIVTYSNQRLHRRDVWQRKNNIQCLYQALIDSKIVDFIEYRT